MTGRQSPGTQAVAGTGAGTMIVVVGPSGAGKDSVMTVAAQHFADEPRLRFCRRVITRPADAGGEAHEAVDAGTFSRMQSAGGFAVSWEAHGLSYGIPASVLDLLGQGVTVIANGSRSALPHFAAAFARLKVVTITARPEVLAERLTARGRESADVIAARLNRTIPAPADELDTSVIDNSGSLDVAGAAFVRLARGVLSG
jgi:ribose 1,5-bisphosphokinase